MFASFTILGFSLRYSIDQQKSFIFLDLYKNGENWRYNSLSLDLVVFSHRPTLQHYITCGAFKDHMWFKVCTASIFDEGFNRRKLSLSPQTKRGFIGNIISGIAN